MIRRYPLKCDAADEIPGREKGVGSFSIRLPTSQFSHSLNQLIQVSDSDSDSPDYSKSTIDWGAGQKVYSRIYRTNGGRDEKRQVKNEDEMCRKRREEEQQQFSGTFCLMGHVSERGYESSVKSYSLKHL